MSDTNELAKLMLLRAEMKEALDEVDQQIADKVMERGESFVVGDVRATYYSPSRTYDYALAAASHPSVDQDLIKRFTTVKETVAWKEVCDAAGVDPDDIPYVEKPARVVVK